MINGLRKERIIATVTALPGSKLLRNKEPNRLRPDELPVTHSSTDTEERPMDSIHPLAPDLPAALATGPPVRPLHDTAKPEPSGQLITPPAGGG